MVDVVRILISSLQGYKNVDDRVITLGTIFGDLSYIKFSPT